MRGHVIDWNKHYRKCKRTRKISSFFYVFYSIFVDTCSILSYQRSIDTTNLTYAKNISHVKKTNYIVPKVLRHQGLDIRKN